jgi:ABC-type multidrug transport system ATPase subunit
MIGERGINLSGGQKARLGLCRALYQDKDIYLMDDPISALDAHVRHQIIENVYFGCLKDRTRILVTHAIDFLERADHIVLMEKGRIICQGDHAEMLKNDKFQEILDINDLNKGGKKDKKEGEEEKKGDKDEKAEEDGEKKDEKDEKPKENAKEEKKEPINIEKELDKAYEEDRKKAEGSDADVYGTDDEEKEKEVPPVVWPSKMTKLEKLRKAIDYQTVKPKEEKEA